ncbi:MAG: Spx/MgsR family RNA polymerase-binding regulatory protein [Deltaproteobacteria bacterium]|jgi:arsenate reductase|nr:Spx/MgsR family RNA polymerase-binding regulatory protein [Deltaproteobacteria bacterium]
MGIKIYEYNGCSTCKKALRFLNERKTEFNAIPIVESPPSLEELRQMVGYLKKRGSDFKKLFNTSGVLYREMKISEKLKGGMTEAEALKLLSENGKLIKRPFILTEKSGTVGFDETEWNKLL